MTLPSLLLTTFASSAIALTTGPAQPEFRSFTPSGTTEFVDLFTGDFQYAIPLFELPGPNGGYQFNLGYRSGVSLEDEASWVGLGFTLNAGMITRQMRGLPDDFGRAQGATNGQDNLRGPYDQVKTIIRMLPSNTYGLRFGADYELFGSDFLAASIESQPYYNSKRGFGVKNTIGLSASFASQYGIGGQVGVHLSNEGGVSASASLSVGQDAKAGASAAYNSLSGLQNLELSAGYKGHTGGVTKEYGKVTELPDTGFETTGLDIQVAIKAGGEVQGSYLNLLGGGFLNAHGLSETDRNGRTVNAYGYIYMQDATPADVVDFNREKDGQIHDNTPNLANPVLTSDIFTIAANGLGGAFRAFRSDIPIVRDRRQVSTQDGTSMNAEIGAGTWAHGGAGQVVTVGNTTVSGWEDENQLLSAVNSANSQLPQSGAFYERVYFKMIGEPSVTARDAGTSLASIGEERPVRPKLEATDIGDWALALLDFEAPIFHRATEALVQDQNDSGKTLALTSAERMPRGNLIEAFTRAEIARSCSSRPDPSASPPSLSPLREFCGRHAMNVDINQDDYRSQKDHHIAGFRITQPDGTRYIFGLASYNIEHEEHEVSVGQSDRIDGASCLISTASGDNGQYIPEDGTDKYLRIRAVGPYATTYLLTAILGPDYVDADETPGPSDGDLGYWVAFRYERKTKEYQWRAPFYGVKFVRGYENGGIRNDRGTFIWGTKELWYLVKAETRTHEAVFVLDNTYKSGRTDVIDYPSAVNRRRDAHGVNTKLQTLDGALGEASYALKSASLYAKPPTGETRGAPLKTVTFIYDYSLAPKTPNTQPPAAGDAKTYDGNVDAGVNTGKLTLRRLEETYKDSLKGRQNAYEFNYASNPDYQEGSQDRWGTHRNLSTLLQRAGAVLPLACSTLASHPALEAVLEKKFTSQADANPQAWNLSQIIEPSGRRVSVEYELDDYAYVQDKPVSQAVALVCSDGTAGTKCSYGCPTDPAIGTDGCDAFVKVPLPHKAGTTQSEHKTAFMQQYLDSTRQIYFRTRLNLGNSRGWQTVSGYAEVLDVEMVSTPTDPPQDYVFRLILKKIDGEHPFHVAAWQHLRLQQPDLLNDQHFPAKIDDISSIGQALTEAAKILTGIDMIQAALGAISGISGVQKELDASGASWIRLRAPAGGVGIGKFRGKYGGGARVRSIIFNDAWRESASAVAAEQCMETGWVYRYTLRDGITSSGVAAYEPMEGGEDNSLRIAKVFADSLPLATDYNLFFEGPVNEAYFPAPVVGYSRVEVESLAADDRRRNVRRNCGGEEPWPTGADAFTMQPTSGITVHEFYTAKDYPVKPAETDLGRKSTSFFIPLLFVGPVSFDDITLSQGYSVILNDMHGKPKRVTHYQHKKAIDSGNPADWENAADEFVRRTTYYYKTRSGNGGGLTNDLLQVTDVLKGEGQIATGILFGRAEEFFIDIRQHEQASWSVGLNVNLDLIAAGPVPVPIVIPWPSISYSAARARTVVTNKVIYQAGILDRVESETGPMKTTQRPVYRDPNTGQPLLETTSNEFGDLVYTYRQPAYWFYPAMGPAYDSSKLALPSSVPAPADGSDGLVLSGADPVVASRLRVGDEFELRESGVPASTAVLTSISSGSIGFRVAGPLPTGAFDLLLTRAGARNQTSTIAGEVKSLADPTAAANRSDFSCPPTVTQVPCGDCFKKEIRKRASEGFLWILSRVGIQAAATGKTSGALERTSTAEVFQKVDFAGAEVRKGAIVARQVGGAKGSSCVIELLSTRGELIDAKDVSRVLKWSEAAIPSAIVRGGMRDLGLLVTVELKGGRRAEVRLFSSCPGLTETYQVVVASPTFCPVEDRSTLTKIKDVLSAHATEFSDDWIESREDIQSVSTARLMVFENWDPHLNGKKGIWRPEKFHEYVTERRPVQPAVALNRRTDGAVDGVLMFPWSNLALLDSCSPEWKLSRQITRYSPYGYELEDLNPLGVKSTALYGYRASVPIAVGANASQNEIGYEGFEEYGDGAIHLPGAPSGNLVFAGAQNDNLKEVLPDVRLEVVEATFCGNFARPMNPRYALQEKGGQFSALGSGLHGSTAASLQAGGGANLFVTVPGVSCPMTMVSTINPPQLGGNPLLAMGAPIPGCDLGGPSLPQAPIDPGLPHCTVWRPGKMGVGVVIHGSGSKAPPAPVVTWVKAHTGKKSLLVNVTTEAFVQTYLNLFAERAYVISAWVSRDNTDAPTLKSTGTLPATERLALNVVFLDADGNQIGTPLMIEPGGAVIEGWQQINGMIETFPAGTASVAVSLQPGKQSRRTASNTVLEEIKPAYFDDIRVFPETGNIETYVYDSSDYRLRASLDKNNFATLFSYDAEGTLFLVRKETVRGLQTVRETRRNLRGRTPGSGL